MSNTSRCHGLSASGPGYFATLLKSKQFNSTSYTPAWKRPPAR
jgi:hypothetical protein